MGGPPVTVTLPVLGEVQIPREWLALAGLGLASFVAFFMLDPFRIIEKVDLRLVRLYRPPERSPVKGRTFLGIVNPVSGSGDGLFQFQRVARPMLKRAGAADIQLKQTTHAGHFGEIGADMARRWLAGDASAFPDGGVLIFGGDGSVNEFYNGVLSAASGGDGALDDPRTASLLQAVKVGHMPTGTSNGLATSYGVSTCYHALEQIIAGNDKLENSVPVDLTEVTIKRKGSKKSERLIDVLNVSWGIFADHDELVENRWRFMGPTLKSILAPLYCLLVCKTYTGTISFKPATVSAAEQERLSKKYHYSDPREVADDPTRKDWKTIKGSFLLAAMSNVAWIASDVCISPDIKFNDGSIGLLLVRGHVSRLQLLRAFLMLESGSVAKLPYVDLYKATAIDLEATKAGGMSVSGLTIHDSRTLKLRTVPRAARLLMAPKKGLHVG